MKEPIVRCVRCNHEAWVVHTLPPSRYRVNCPQCAEIMTLVPGIILGLWAVGKTRREAVHLWNKLQDDLVQHTHDAGWIHNLLWGGGK